MRHNFLVTFTLLALLQQICFPQCLKESDNMSGVDAGTKISNFDELMALDIKDLKLK